MQLKWITSTAILNLVSTGTTANKHRNLRTFRSQPIPKPNYPTKTPQTHIPIAHPPPPPQLQCGDATTENTNFFGTIPAFYEDLPTCDDFSIDLTLTDVSSVRRVKGKKGAAIKLKAKCQTKTSNQNTILVYSRKHRQGLSFTQNYQCDQHQTVVCGGPGSMGSVEILAQTGMEYLFVTLHTGVGDVISTGVSCTTPTSTPRSTKVPTKKPTNKPTNKPTRKPTYKPAPVAEIKCGEGKTQKTQNLNQINALYENLPPCFGVGIDLDMIDASSIYTAQGVDDMFLEMRSKCRTNTGNINTLLMYSRTSQPGLGLLEGYRCEKVEMVECNRLAAKGSIEIDTNSNREYILVTMHEGVGDIISFGATCDDNTKPPPPSYTIAVASDNRKDNTTTIDQSATMQSNQFQCKDVKGSISMHERSTANLSQIQSDYEELPQCDGFSIDLGMVDASSVHNLQGSQDLTVKLKTKCRTLGGNANTMLIYSRRSGGGITDGYQCEKAVVVNCDSMNEIGSVKTSTKPGREYLVVSMHDGLGDIISYDVSCV